MSDSASPFDDFAGDDNQQQTQQQTHDEDPFAAPVAVDGVDAAPVDDDDIFGVSSGADATEVPPAADDDDIFGNAGVEESVAPAAEHDDPFAAAPEPAAEEEQPEDPLAGVQAVQEPSFEELDDGPLSKWRAEREIVLSKRAEDAAEEKRALAKKGQEDVANFYTQRDERIEKAQANNRTEEKEFRTELENTFKFGTKWEKVGKLVNLNPNQEDKRETERMRKLLIQLKNDKSAAAAAPAE